MPAAPRAPPRAPRPVAALALALLLAPALAGCALLAPPCTEQAPRAELRYPPRSMQEVRAALLDLGWVLQDQQPGADTRALIHVDGTLLRLRASADGAGPDGMALAVVEGGAVELATEAEARALLAPAVEPLVERLGAQAAYHGGRRHCGDV